MEVNGLHDRHLYYDRAVQNRIGEPKVVRIKTQFQTELKRVPGEKAPTFFSSNFKEKEVMDLLIRWRTDLNQNLSQVNNQYQYNGIKH